jgi:hypothetical protein
MADRQEYFKPFNSKTAVEVSKRTIEASTSGENRPAGSTTTKDTKSTKQEISCKNPMALPIRISVLRVLGELRGKELSFGRTRKIE